MGCIVCLFVWVCKHQVAKRGIEALFCPALWTFLGNFRAWLLHSSCLQTPGFSIHLMISVSILFLFLFHLTNDWPSKCNAGQLENPAQLLRPVPSQLLDSERSECKKIRGPERGGRFAQGIGRNMSISPKWLFNCLFFLRRNADMHVQKTVDSATTQSPSLLFHPVLFTMGSPQNAAPPPLPYPSPVAKTVATSSIRDRWIEKSKDD